VIIGSDRKGGVLNKIHSKILIGIILPLFLISCRYKQEIPVIGWDKDGNPVQFLIPETEYRKRMTALASTLRDSAIPVLNRTENSGQWDLRSISLGIGLNTEISLGDLYRIGAFPRFRLIFSKSPSDSLP